MHMENRPATLIDFIEHAMSIDREGRKIDSDCLISIYEDATVEGKTSVDRSLIALCGLPLKTLIEKAESCKYLTAQQSLFLFPLTRDEAKERFRHGKEIYRIYPDGTEALLEKAEELDLEEAQFAAQK
jgi:hypothetical protein